MCLQSKKQKKYRKIKKNINIFKYKKYCVIYTLINYKFILICFFI